MSWRRDWQRLCGASARMRSTVREWAGNEGQAVCFARLHGESKGMAADRGGAADRCGRGRIGSVAAACDCVHDQPLLLPSAEPGDGWACRVAAFAEDHAAGAG